MHLDDSEDYAYVIEHCADFGLVRRYDESKTAITGISGEDWHFRYVGVPHALYMTEKDLCLEEYLELLQKHTALNPLELTTSDTKYTMYFVTPRRRSYRYRDRREYSETYSISGTACGGYAVSYSEPVYPAGDRCRRRCGIRERFRHRRPETMPEVQHSERTKFRRRALFAISGIL